ncbi:MAG: sulfotransferase [Pseudoxanthomonas sp.]
MNAGLEAAAMEARAMQALRQGDWAAAERLAGQGLAMFPEQAGLHFAMGVTAAARRRWQQAVGYFGEAAKLRPDRADHAVRLAEALANAHHLREALAEAGRALSLGPKDAALLQTLGVVFIQGNEHARAHELFRKVASLKPEWAGAHFNLALTSTYVGDLDGAEREYQICIEREPKLWPAYLGLSELRRQTLRSNHVQLLEDRLQQVGDDAMARLHLGLALSKEYDDVGDHSRAFEHARAGKAAWRARLGYTFERDRAMFEAVLRSFPEPLQGARGSDSSEPIFIVGMPRTGTTLVERILSSHPQVHSAGELGHFPVALHRAAAKPAASLEELLSNLDLSALDWKALGDGYVASTRPGTGHVPRFIDKLPFNFLYLGFIATALPKARIICLRRHPLDTCLANFVRMFSLASPNYDYSFDLLDTGRYYLMFDRLMAHWKRILPGRVLELPYEQLVTEQEASTRRLLEFCGLPWDEACLHFERNAAPVATASAVQVRSPMFRSSLQRRERYKAWLEPLRTLIDEGEIEAHAIPHISDV